MTRMTWGAAMLLGVASAYAQAPAGRVADSTFACRTDAEFSRYAYLVADDKTAAAVYLVEHHCATLKPGTPIHLEKGSAARDSNHVCIRPVGYTECVWTYAAHINLD
jgi:hypothetical protein